jgi:hypothetical protein
MFSIIQRKHLFFIFIIIALFIITIEIISINMNIAWRNVLTGSSITLYMTPYCECCVKYKDYLSSLGAKVEVATVEDVDKLMEKLGVPSKLWSCHLATIDGYIIVGHVPAEAIKKLLDERPDIKGISLPDMPSGSPGMPGIKEKPFIIYSFDETIEIFVII